MNCEKYGRNTTGVRKKVITKNCRTDFMEIWYAYKILRCQKYLRKKVF